MTVTHNLCFLCCDLHNWAPKKERFNASLMSCEPTWTASGQTHWVVVEWLVGYPKCLGFSSTLLQQQNTCTGMNTDSRAGRAVHSGETIGQHSEEVSQHNNAGSSMSYVWIQDKTFHRCPFCFSALQDSRNGAEVPGADMTSGAAPGPRDRNTSVFVQPSAWNSAIWWTLDAQARLI